MNSAPRRGGGGGGRNGARFSGARGARGGRGGRGAGRGRKCRKREAQLTMSFCLTFGRQSFKSYRANLDEYLHFGMNKLKFVSGQNISSFISYV